MKKYSFKEEIRTMLKPMYTTTELDKQMDYQDAKCARCMCHECKNFGCKTQNVTAKVAERTPNITAEQKKRYFALVGA